MSSPLAYGVGGGDDLGGIGVPPWITAPYQHLNWWDMQRFIGQNLHSALVILGLIDCELSEGDVDVSASPSIGNDARKKLASEISAVAKGLNQTGFKTAASATADFMTALVNCRMYPMTKANARAYIKEIHNTIRREMSTILFVYIPSDYVKWYDSPLEGWEDVTKRWPKIATDIEESSKCFAFERFAASIFHVLLVAEFGVIQLATLLGVQGDKPGWGSLDRLEKIRHTSYLQRTPEQQKHSQLLDNSLPLMLAVKDSWRHKITHVDNKLVWLDTVFSPQIAIEIIMATRGLMRRLAEDLPT